jgi:hypothetical protein
MNSIEFCVIRALHDEVDLCPLQDAPPSAFKLAPRYQRAEYSRGLGMVKVTTGLCLFVCFGAGGGVSII